MIMKLLVLLVAALVVLASAKTSTLYARVSIQGRTSSSDHIVALDPKTGATKDIMQTFVFNVENSAVHGLSAMDKNGVYYYASGANPFPNFVCRANVNSQTMMSHGAYPITQLISFAYDTNQERLFVAGAPDSSLDIPLPFGTQLVSWPTAAGSYPKVYAQLDTDGSFIATTGAIDSANQIYYWISMPKPNTIFLKSLSVATAFGQVNSVQLQCNNQLDPLSMTFDSVRQKLMLYGGLYNKNEGMYTLYINTVDSTGKCNAVMTSLTYRQYLSAFAYDEVNQVLYVSVDSTLYTLNARTGAIINTVTVANELMPYTLDIMYN